VDELGADLDPLRGDKLSKLRTRRRSGLELCRDSTAGEVPATRSPTVARIDLGPRIERALQGSHRGAYVRFRNIIYVLTSEVLSGARRARRGETGRLIIGFHISLSTGKLRATLLDYPQRFPAIMPGLIESSAARADRAPSRV
jgi:hypothetical protein